MQKRKSIATIVGLTLLCLIALGLFMVRSNGRSAPIAEKTNSPEGIGPEPGFVEAAEDTARHECEQRLNASLAEPALPGAAKLEQNRIELFFRAKGEPVLFVKTPDYVAEEITPMVKSYRRLLTKASPWNAVETTFKNFGKLPGYARQTLLKDGYLYADDPALAFALVQLVSPDDLFGHDKIWIERGEKVLHAERRHGRYYYSDGPSVGDPVHLLVFDRIGSGDPTPNPLHRDLRSLRYRLHFDRMDVRHITEQRIVADLHYGNVSVPTLLSSEGARLNLECEVIDPGAKAQIVAFREVANRRQRVTQVLRGSMLEEIIDGLPFDEPKHEYGHQLDGSLRRNWRSGYFGRQATYNFNGDKYLVFNKRGNPLVPQVCVDFITDTIERASGTWYRGKGEQPGKSKGGWDFGTELDKPWLRRAPEFVAYVSEHEDWFDVKNPPKSEQIQLRERSQLIDYFKTHRADYQPGDIVIIKGRTPWDRRTMHYHSFFIYDTDPISGLPLVIVGNAGRPSVRAWEIEARRTPKRMIQHRLRPSLEWLETIFKDRLASVGDEPLSLSPAGSVD
jgi:hypothetical protein